MDKLLRDEQQYTLIMYSFPIDHSSLSLVEEYARRHKVPLISIHSAGFYSYFRINLPGTFPIVDTHPDSTATTDLRLLSPWPELSKFADDLTVDIDNLNAHDHGHIPYVALLLYYLKKWKGIHGTIPTTYKEKTAFREMVSAGARADTPEGGEENFEEAAAAVLKTVAAPSLASSVREVFEYEPDSVRIIQRHLSSIRHFANSMHLGRIQVKFLDHSQCYQTILHRAPSTTPARFRTGHESPINNLCTATKFVQGKSSAGRGGGPRNCAKTSSGQRDRYQRSGDILQKCSFHKASPWYGLTSGKSASNREKVSYSCMFLTYANIPQNKNSKMMKTPP